MKEGKMTRWANNKAYQYKIEHHEPRYVKAPNIWIDEYLSLTVWFQSEIVYHNCGFRNPEEAHFELNLFLRYYKTEE